MIKIPQRIAGPCSAESREQLFETADRLLSGGFVDCFRAGIWKPRTRPNSFEGVGEKGLEWLCEVRERTSLPVMCEVATAEHVSKVLEYGLDGVWIGARTTINPFYVQDIADRLAGTELFVMVKNPVSHDMPIWYGAIERLRNAGVKDIAAIHRGFISSEERVLRNHPAWSSVIEFRSAFPDIPLICDPSHIAGKRSLVPLVAQKAIDLDMYGLMVEVHSNPNEALSDKEQQLTPEGYTEMIKNLRVSSEIPTKGEQVDMLKIFRKEVDIIDDGLLKLLSKRMLLSKEIGNYKREHGIKILQISRWEQMLNERLAMSSELGLDRELIKELLQLLHKASIDIQSK